MEIFDSNLQFPQNSLIFPKNTQKYVKRFKLLPNLRKSEHKLGKDAKKLDVHETLRSSKSARMLSFQKLVTKVVKTLKKTKLHTLYYAVLYKQRKSPNRIK